MASIKTGICSFGMSGKLFHAPFIEAHPGFEFTAIVERSKNEVREKYPRVNVLRSVEELINDPAIELVIVNTPVQTHYEFTRKALEAGKNVVVEKPYVVNSDEAAELTALAKQKNVFLSVYQNRRYDGDYQAIKAIVDLKLLGDLKEVEMRYDRYRPGFSGKQHKEGNVTGAGTLYDLGSHLIDQALQLFGWPGAVFADVWAMREGGEADDYFELLLYYKKMRVRLKGSGIVKESVPAYILHGIKGSYLQKRSDLQEEQLLAGAIPSVEPWCKAFLKADGLLHTEFNGEEIRKETHSTPGNYMGYYQDVYESLTQQKPNPVPGTDAEKVIKIIEAALASEAGKKIITL